jgi:hypothetical protein
VPNYHTKLLAFLRFSSPFSPACSPPAGGFFARNCTHAGGTVGIQISTNFWGTVCDELGIGGSGKYCGENYAHLGRINVFYHEAFGGKYVPRAVLFDLEPGVIGSVALSRRSASSSARGNLVNHTRG